MFSSSGNKLNEPTKSWKKINEERKALKKQRKQDKVIRDLENANKLEELSKNEPETTKLNPSTVSIAVPGSILENAQSPELRSYVAGQIARAACIYRVHEIIVFDDICMDTARETKQNYDDVSTNGSTVRSSSLQLARILQYLECPQYLRKFFFPLHKDLKYSGLLNPLDAPHHLRKQNVFPYREGIVTDKPTKSGQKYVNVGLQNDVLVDQDVAEGMRVTVKLNLNDKAKKLRGTLVSPNEPRRETGAYWGYTVRIAHSFSDIFTKTPYKEGYDLTIGTSDRGKHINEVNNRSLKFNHLLIVFGGLKGLEVALANDDKLNIEDPELLFDNYLNILPRQGARTIRTEEALLIAMAVLQEKLCPHVEDIEEQFKDLLPRSEETGITHINQNIKPKKRKFVEETAINNEEINNKTNYKTSFKSNSNNFSTNKTKHPTQTSSNVETTELDDFEVVSTTHELKNSADTTDLDDLNRFD